MNKRARIFRRRSNIIMNIAESENVDTQSPCNKALNQQITSLKDKIAGLEAELASHQWISVEDGLPDAGIYEWFQLGNACYGNPQEYCCGTIKEKKAYLIELGYTHWKPIIEP